MSELPTIETERLTLRPFILADAPDVQRLAGDRNVASSTLEIPHPYKDGMAEEWIAALQVGLDRGEDVTFAIVHRDEEYLIGCAGMSIRKRDESGSMGYWIGKPYWNQGYCTEAARALLEYGFEVLGLNRVYSAHFTRNPASGRVMQKIGMKHEGTLRQDVRKWGRFEDVERYGILKSEYASSDE